MLNKSHTVYTNLPNNMQYAPKSLTYVNCYNLQISHSDIIYTVQLKNAQTPKMWLVSNAWKFLHQILYAF